MPDTYGERMKAQGLSIALLYAFFSGPVGWTWLGETPQGTGSRCTSLAGNVQVTLFEAGSEKSKDKFTIFSINPLDGAISESPGRSVGGLSPRGAFFGECDKGTRVPSPDGRSIATCQEKADKEGSVSVLLILDSKTKSPLVRVPLAAKSVLAGVAWSPDSKAIAYLVKRQMRSNKPLDLLSAAAGHPVPYNSYGLKILCLATGEGHEMPNVIKEKPNGLAWVEWLASSGRSRVANPSSPK